MRREAPARKARVPVLSRLSSHAPRKGAARMSEIPPDVLKALNEGRIETITLVEWLAIDVATLARHAIPQVGLDGKAGRMALQAAESLAKEGVLVRSKGMGDALFEAMRAHPRGGRIFDALARHPSDMVRAWAARSIGADPDLTLAARIERSRPFAADASVAVRECAWDVFRPYLAADLERGIRLLRPWVRDADPNVRRCAVEATRPRGVWTAHIGALKDDPEPGRPLLEPVRSDSSRYVQRAVANWINDASKTRSDWATRLCARWLKESPTESTRWTVNHALRTLRRKAGVVFTMGAALIVPTVTLAGSAAPTTSPDPRVIQAQTRFGFRLYAEIVKKEPGRNLFISPPSVAMALSIAVNGAAGRTTEAMKRTLEVPDIGIEELNRSSAALLSALEESDPKVRVIVANSLWARQDLSFEKPFLDAGRAFYRAEARLLDFRDPGSSGVINGWVKEKTQGRIPAIVDRISADAALFILNAVYFKGTWTTAFDPTKTHDLPFTLLDGSKVQVPMMQQTEKYDHLRGEGFEAVSLPYGSGRFRMCFFLPDASVGLAGFHRSLTADKWATWMRSFNREKGSILLPRFKTEYETSLNRALASLGMAEAFDSSSADFTAMLKGQRVAITEVKHKTFLEVNEEGTEAAAATSVKFRLTSAELPPFHLTLDRPFFCAIVDGQTGTMLFIGSITNPR